MTTTSISKTGYRAAEYREAHAKMLRFLAAYYDEMTSARPLDDLDEYVVKTVSPAFGRTVDPHLFDEALTAYIAVHDVKDGSHPDIVRNSTRTTDNTMQVLDYYEDRMDFEIRHLLETVGVN